MVRLAIVALVPAVRAGLRALLGGDGVQVVGEGATVAALAPLLPEADVLLVGDEATPTELATHITEELALVLLGDPVVGARTVRAVEPQAWALLPLDASAAAMRAAVLAVAEGLAVLQPALAKQGLGAGAAEDDLLEPLTARELEVLEQVSYGLANKEIARALQISEHTVKFHLASVFSKLDASSRTEAVSRAARLGLIML